MILNLSLRYLHIGLKCNNFRILNKKTRSSLDISKTADTEKQIVANKPIATSDHVVNFIKSGTDELYEPKVKCIAIKAKETNRNTHKLKSPFVSKIFRGNVASVECPLDIRNDTKAIDFKELNIIGRGVTRSIICGGVRDVDRKK